MYLIDKPSYLLGLFLLGVFGFGSTTLAQLPDSRRNSSVDYVDYLPKYQQVSQHFIISKIAYSDEGITLFFYFVSRKDNDLIRFYGQDREMVWRLSQQSRSKTTFNKATLRLAEVSNIRLNDELIRAKLNKRSNTDLEVNKGDIVSCEIHFKNFPPTVRSVYLLGGDCTLKDPTVARFNCKGILLKSAESGLLSNAKQMLANINRFYTTIGFVKYPDIKQATTLQQETSLDKKALGHQLAKNKDLFEKYLKPINYMPTMLIGQKDFKCNERVIMTDIHFHEKRPDFISRSKALASLNMLIDYLMLHADIKVAVHAHTDIHGNAFSNLEISNKHVHVIKKILLNKGIDDKRIIAIHHGGAQTLQRYKNGSAMNRRIEVEILCNDTSTSY